MFLHRIVQAFEKIATSFVQQDDFKTLDIIQNQTRFVAEKVGEGVEGGGAGITIGVLLLN